MFTYVVVYGFFFCEKCNMVSGDTDDLRWSNDFDLETFLMFVLGASIRIIAQGRMLHECTLSHVRCSIHGQDRLKPRDVKAAMAGCLALNHSFNNSLL